MESSIKALNYDVVIIGAGVVGSAIAMELSRYQIKAALIEKNSDVGFETSSRNSGVVHAGFNYLPSTLRARLCVEGNEMLHKMSDELQVKMQNIGKLTVAKDEEDLKTLKRLLSQGRKNKVPGIEIIEQDRMNSIQNKVTGKWALYSPTSSIINPYHLTIELAETAYLNGVDIYLNTCVEDVSKQKDRFIVNTDKCIFESKIVINSAGLNSAAISKLAGVEGYHIYPCKGEYWILDRKKSGFLSCLIYPTPRKNEPGLGIHLTPTTRGNIMIGPSAEYCNNSTNYSCSTDVLAELKKQGGTLTEGLDSSDLIRHFSGIRPKQTPPEVGGNADFIIKDEENVKGLINLIGIESPGLTAAPAIAKMVRDMVGTHINILKKSNWSYKKEFKKKYRDMTDFERVKAVEKDPLYGQIVCRCEQVTYREIIDAINNPIGAISLRSIKMRTGAMMGRCQSGFCISKILDILTREAGISMDEIYYGYKDTQMFDVLRNKR